MEPIIQAIREEISQVIVGKEQEIDLLLTALLANGHVLLEDVPGTGKTLMAKALARCIDGIFGRIQFTPDLLPADITGINYYNPKEGQFTLRKGPVFCQVLLADEINRATPRTQSGLLECMEERQVTIDAVSYDLATPFFVIATENPIETAGTFPLPEAQLDRFLMKLSMGLPTPEEELMILSRFQADQPLKRLRPAASLEQIRSLQQKAQSIYVHPHLMEYLVNLVQATRCSQVLAGVSPRGSLAYLHGIQAYAMVKGRDYVVPEDIKTLAVPVLAHRIVMGMSLGGHSRQDEFVNGLLQSIPVPTENWGPVQTGRD